MGNVPGTNSCPVADVVTLVPSQAAACDRRGFGEKGFKQSETSFRSSASPLTSCENDNNIISEFE